jgi:hypothetical protein
LDSRRKTGDVYRYGENPAQEAGSSAVIIDVPYAQPYGGAGFTGFSIADYQAGVNMFEPLSTAGDESFVFVHRGQMLCVAFGGKNSGATIAVRLPAVVAQETTTSPRGCAAHNMPARGSCAAGVGELGATTHRCAVPGGQVMLGDYHRRAGANPRSR